jgi:adenosylhomocysteinase
MLLAGLDQERTSAFFSAAWSSFDVDGAFPRAALITVAHALGSHLPFFGQIQQNFNPVLFHAKARSQDIWVIHQMIDMLGWKRSPFAENDIGYVADTASAIETLLDLGEEDLFIIDVGGKWASGDAVTLKALMTTRRVHVVEGTENGYIKYEHLLSTLNPEESQNLRVWSVARSRLKDAEDSLTGTAIVEATETIVRVNYGLLKDHPATVFGYGKIGRSVAHALRDKHLHVGVVEINPLLTILARADGFEVRTCARAQELGGYVFLATGSAKREHGLHLDLLRQFKQDTLVTFVTSVDDELKGSDEFDVPGFLRPVHEFKPSEIIASSGIQESAVRVRVRENLVECLHYIPTDADTNVVIVNRGSPPNFLFEASCGPYIFLVFFGMLACLFRSWEGAGESGLINVLSEADEDRIGGQWLARFVEIE